MSTESRKWCMERWVHHSSPLNRLHIQRVVSSAKNCRQMSWKQRGRGEEGGGGGQHGAWAKKVRRWNRGALRQQSRSWVVCADNRVRERRMAKLTQCAGNFPRRGVNTSSRCTLSKWCTKASGIGCGGAGGRGAGVVPSAGEKSQK